MNAATQLASYLELVDVSQKKLRATKPTDSPVRKLLKNAVPIRFRGTTRMLLTDALMPYERHKAKELSHVGELRLHLGCGGVRKEGWVNIDLLGDPVDIAWDLAKPLPFEDGAVDAVFHEHLLEHLPLSAGISFSKEVVRVVRPGGIVRVGVPDAGRLLRSYVDPSDDYLDRNHPGRPTRLLAAQELFYWHRHVTMYDAETLAMVLEAAGLEQVTERPFGDSDLGQAPDTDSRRVNSLYMEGRRPL
jgi:predicted SAM-dependent methyltransferase